MLHLEINKQFAHEAKQKDEKSLSYYGVYILFFYPFPHCYDPHQNLRIYTLCFVLFYLYFLLILSTPNPASLHRLVENQCECMQDFMSQDSLILLLILPLSFSVVLKHKRSEKQIDIKPSLHASNVRHHHSLKTKLSPLLPIFFMHNVHTRMI